MVSTRPLISKSFSSFISPLVTVPSAPITIGITVTFMFHSFSSKAKVLIFLFAFFQFYPVVSLNGKVYYSAGSFFFFLLLTLTRSGRMAEIKWYLLLIRVFLHQRKLMVFHWSLSESKSPQVSKTLLSILAVFNNAIVWMTSTRSPTSKSSRPFNKPLVTVPKAPITIGMIVTFMFHSFFNSLAISRYLSLFSHSFSFILWSTGTAKSIILQIFFFCWLL